jgi:hypothetical protein
LEGNLLGKERRCKFEVSIRMDFREIWWENVDWIILAQDEDKWWTVVNVIMGSIKVAKFLDYPSNWHLIMMALLHDIWDKTFTISCNIWNLDSNIIVYQNSFGISWVLTCGNLNV